MQRHHGLRLVAIAAAALLTAAAPTWAQVAQNQTTVVLAAPIQIPGMTLPAGTYTFETAPGQGGSHTVRIFGSDRSKPVATAEAVPMKRNGALSDLVELRPTVLGTAPTALQGWLRPNASDGFQFVYPAREAAEIANRTATRVVARGADAEKGAPLVIVDAYGKQSPWTSDAGT